MFVPISRLEPPRLKLRTSTPSTNTWAVPRPHERGATSATPRPVNENVTLSPSRAPSSTTFGPVAVTSIGCFGTLAVGVVGALLGGFLGEAVFDEDIDFGWDLKPFLLAGG